MVLQTALIYGIGAYYLVGAGMFVYCLGPNLYQDSKDSIVTWWCGVIPKDLEAVEMTNLTPPPRQVMEDYSTPKVR